MHNNTVTTLHSAVPDAMEICSVIIKNTVSQKNDNDVAHYNFNAH